MGPGLDESVSLATRRGATPPAAAGLRCGRSRHAGQTPALAADALSDGRLAGGSMPPTALRRSAARAVPEHLHRRPRRVRDPTRVTVGFPTAAVWRSAAELGANNGREYHQTRLLAVRSGDRTGQRRRRSVPADRARRRGSGRPGPHSHDAAAGADHGPQPRIAGRDRRPSRHRRARAPVRRRPGRRLDPRPPRTDDRLRLRNPQRRGKPGHHQHEQRQSLRELRRLVGARVQLDVTVHDFARHHRAYDRWTEIGA